MHIAFHTRISLSCFSSLPLPYLFSSPSPLPPSLPPNAPFLGCPGRQSLHRIHETTGHLSIKGAKDGRRSLRSDLWCKFHLLLSLLKAGKLENLGRNQTRSQTERNRRIQGQDGRLPSCEAARSRITRKRQWRTWNFKGTKQFSVIVKSFVSWNL